MTVPLLHYEGTGKSPPRIGLAHPSICPYGAFETKDGQLVLIAIQNEREWAASPSISWMRPTCRARRLPHQQRSRGATADGRCAYRRRLRRADAGGVRGEAPPRHTAYGFVNDCEGLRTHPALRRVVVETPKGPVAIGARRRCCPTGRGRWGRCRASASIRRRSGRNSVGKQDLGGKAFPPNPTFAFCKSGERARGRSRLTDIDEGSGENTFSPAFPHSASREP